MLIECPKLSRLGRTQTCTPLAAFRATAHLLWATVQQLQDRGVQELLRRLLLCAHESTGVSEIVIVLDNSPCHTRAEEVLGEDEHSGATLLRLGPHSPMLNPLEDVFSTVKAAIKRDLAAHREDTSQQPRGMTQKAH